MIDTKALREKILDLAIRGRLVPQDPNDEPASLLLDRIRVQKQQMVKEGKLKAKDIKNDTIIFKGEDNLHYEQFQNGTVKCIENEIPFETPESWAWARLRTISFDLPYGTSKKSSSNGKIAVLRMGNLQNSEIDYSKFTELNNEEDIKKYSLIKGDLLFNRTNSIELVGKTSVYRGDIPAIYAGYLIRIRSSLNSEYLNTVMNSSYAREYCTSVRTDAVNQSNINAAKLGNILIAVPSISEQKRISKKTSESIKVINIIEQEKMDLQTMATNVKSKILDLAIRGKLVPQDPNDEPASVLLERIRAEKKELIKQGKIKRDKKESVIFKGEDNSYYEKIGDSITCIDDELPFEIPPSWIWCRLGEIFSHNTGKALNSSNTTGYLMTYITTSNLYWDRFVLDSLKKMRFSENEIEKCTVGKGDLLVCEGGDIGRAAIWMFDEEIRIQNHIHKLRPYTESSVSNRFFYYVFYLWKQMDRIGGHGIGLQGFSSKVLHNLLIPLPPLKEQLSIVSKIDCLFSVLEGVEKSLS